jgi:hypothetical protein
VTTGVWIFQLILIKELVAMLEDRDKLADTVALATTLRVNL